MPKIVLLTGKMGAGKSVVCKLLESHNVPVLDADVVARNIQDDPTHPCLAELQEHFPGCLTEVGVLNRSWMRELVSRDEYANKLLVHLMTPYVMTELYRESYMRSAHSAYVVWESALIQSSSSHIDYSVLVDASEDVRIARIQSRNPDWPYEQIVGLLSKQDRWFTADAVIYNDGTQQELVPKIAALHASLIRKWGSK